MATINTISATLPPGDAKEILAAIATIRAKLPFLIDLTPAQRHGLPKLGDKSLSFVSKAVEIAAQNEDILPKNFDLAEYQKDVALFQTLTPIVQALRQITELVDDTTLAAGSDAYAASLVVYQLAKIAGKGQGIDRTLDDLGKRFAKRAAQKPEKPTA